MMVSHLRIRLPLPLARAARSIRAHSPPLNFITLHYAYFLGVCLISSVIFWGSSTPARSVSYTDSLFLTVSAMTLAGLNTINLSELNTFQQFILFSLIMLGSAILVSSVVVQVRRKAFERKFQAITEWKRKSARSEKGAEGRPSSIIPISETHSMSRANTDGQVPRGRNLKTGYSMDRVVTNGNADEVEKQSRKVENGVFSLDTTPRQQGSLDVRADGLDYSNHGNEAPPTPSAENLSRPVRFSSQISPGMSPLRARAHSRVFSMQGVGARGDLLNHPRRASVSLSRSQTEEKAENGLGFPSTGFIGRNSQFHNLTLAEREHLGGVEYRAITLLAIIVPVYFVLWQLLGSLGIGAYIARNRASTTLQNGINPWWTGAFNAVSAFNNSGMSLLDANMVAFQTSEYMLITMGLMILAGNTCYPVFLRLIIWTIYRLLPDTPAMGDYRVTLRFLLDHPRRCYTNLFPSTHTWWLLGTIILLNSIDWGAFELLNIGNTSIQTLPRGTRVLDGLFQALAVRSGGFYVVPIANLRIGLLVLYVVMMYISVYPVVITMRNSNVYEERSLGIYADERRPRDDHPPPDATPPRSFTGRLRRRLTGPSAPEDSRAYFVRQQLRGQLAHDLWWIVLAVLFITITETGQFERDPVDYSVFNVVFEVISAYGCVGISVGLPNVAYSFCGGWHVLSKLILCAVMIRGRHRGLPVAIDRAVLLPGEHLAAAEEEDAQIRMERTLSRGQGL